MSHNLSSGIIAAAILPFTDSGAIDWNTLDRYIVQVAAGQPRAIAMNMAVSEVKAGGLAWMLSALGFPDYPGELYGYWTVIGTGNAVVGWDPQLKGAATTQGAA